VFEIIAGLPIAFEALTPVTETVVAPSSTAKLPIACVAFTPVTETSSTVVGSPHAALPHVYLPHPE
jgi:hypothetical protein